MVKMKFVKFNKEFPYRTLNEICTQQDLYNIFSDNMFYQNDSKLSKINRKLAEYFYIKYGDRYPVEQRRDVLMSLISQVKDTYLDTFYNYTLRLISNSNLSIDLYKQIVNRGNVLTYNTQASGDNHNTTTSNGSNKNHREDTSTTQAKNGTSASPYNLAFDNISNALDNDNLLSKVLAWSHASVVADERGSNEGTTQSDGRNSNTSVTRQENANNDIIKRTEELMNLKMSGEINNFLNSFYNLFAQISLDEYIEDNLNWILSYRRNEINFLIDTYNELMQYIILKEKQ